MNEYHMSTGVKDPSGDTWYLLSPDVVPDVSGKLAAGMAGTKVGVSLTSLANTIYSSLGKNGISRTQAAAYWKQSLEALHSKIPYLTAETPNAYAFPYLQQADDAPMASSRFDVMDTDIPFYQLVAHGAMVMYTEPLNERGSTDTAILRMAEYGLYPSWRLIARDPALLSGTDGADWFAMSLSAWQEDVVRIAKQMEALAPYAALRMIGHERISADVSVTTYENGDRVIVNYGKTDAAVEGVTVPAQSFTIKEMD